MKELKEQAVELAKVYKGDIEESEIVPEVESFKYHALVLDRIAPCGCADCASHKGA